MVVPMNKFVHVGSKGTNFFYIYTSRDLLWKTPLDRQLIILAIALQ